MATMTEDEAFALDKKWTETTPKVGPNDSGSLAKHKVAYSITIDGLSANYVFSKAMATHKTPADIIGEMVQKEIAAAL